MGSGSMEVEQFSGRIHYPTGTYIYDGSMGYRSWNVIREPVVQMGKDPEPRIYTSSAFMYVKPAKFGGIPFLAIGVSTLYSHSKNNHHPKIFIEINPLDFCVLNKYVRLQLTVLLKRSKNNQSQKPVHVPSF